MKFLYRKTKLCKEKTYLTTLNVCMVRRFGTMSLRKQTPSDFLKQIIGRPVVVKLNSGVDYRGVLACLDGYMNIALEQTEEYVNGQLKNKYGDAFIRGNNATMVMGVVYKYTEEENVSIPEDEIFCIATFVS
ncbi:hypothetical protein JD844_026773 [Phrynosoma platyrhinos]|uniref:Sm domain-containing protein n=1 Tax=Phrynosoma platyrhinos TaxID=52577 RepID=A0ABQ7SF95_PHRPL|nr:hypothetical protein JD844_026773 [Phrynosoma platyrhinos]